MDKLYDVIIIGGGPAGLSAAIYAARSGVKTAVVESLTPGGVAATTPTIENYPGAGSVSGWELARRMHEQATACGAQVVYAKAERIEDGTPKTVILASGETLHGKALVLALGNEPRKLGIADEQSWLGAGLSYCATCDGNFFRGKTVAVVGSGTHAEESAQYLLPLAKKVYRLHAGKLAHTEGAREIENARVTALEGKPLRAVRYSDTSGEHTLAVDGLFVSLGYTPAVHMVKDLVDTDRAGFIVCDEHMQTSREGIFAAGDATHKVLRQIVTAAADGAIAGTFAAVYAKRH